MKMFVLCFILMSLLGCSGGDTSSDSLPDEGAVETPDVLPITGNFIDNDDSLYKINDDVRFSKSTVPVVDTKFSCDCNSTDPSIPCVGSSLTDKLTGTPSNGATFRAPIFSYEFNSNGGQAYCGRFASGDYWVAPKEGETLQLTKISGNSQVSAELDLANSTSTGILGSLVDYGNYDETKNATLNLPISLDTSNNQLLLTAMHREVGECGTKAIIDGCVDAYNFVTFLTGIPKNLGWDMMRPNVGANPNNLYTFDDFNLDRLIASSEFEKASADELKSANEAWRGFTEIFTNFSEGGRAFRSHTLVDDYSSGTYNGWYNSFVKVSSSANTFEEKKAALASMLTFGADMYQVFEGNNTIGTQWSAGAGQFTGMIAPLLFFSSIIERPDIAYQVSQISKRANVGEAGDIGEEGYTALQDAALPQEFKQILPGRNGPVWGDITTINRYWSAIHAGGCYDGSLVECNSSQGKKTSWDPYGYIDGPSIKPGSSYMSVTRGMFGNYGTMMWMNDSMCDIANHDLPIQYVDRIKSNGLLTSNDECAPPDPREPDTCDPWRDGVGCSFYGETWGPTTDNPYQCVKNNSGGNTGQNGRFPDYNGTVIEANGYVNFTLENSYDTFKEGRDNCRSAIFNTTPAVSNFENDNGVLKWAASTHLSNDDVLDYEKHFGWYKVSYISPDSTERAVFATTETSFDTALLDDGVSDFIVQACLYNGSCVVLTEQQ